MMKRGIVITPRAQSDFEKVFQHLALKWNEKVKIKFSNKIKDTVSLIAENPEMFPISNKNRNIRKCVISKQSILFYHFDAKNIVIVSLFDTRQNPDKIKNIK